MRQNNISAKKINMQCCRAFTSECELGEQYFPPPLSNWVFKEYSEHFEGVSNMFHILKSFKAFQTGS